MSQSARFWQVQFGRGSPAFLAFTWQHALQPAPRRALVHAPFAGFDTHEEHFVLRVGSQALRVGRDRIDRHLLVASTAFRSSRARIVVGHEQARAAQSSVLAERRISGELKLHTRSSDLRHMLSRRHREWTSMESFEAGTPTPLNQEEEVRCSESLGRLLYTDLRSMALATGWPTAMIRQQSIRNCAD